MARGDHRDRRHTVLASLRAEARLLDQMALRLMGEVVGGLTLTPRQQQQRSDAARARWGAPRDRRGVS